MNASKVFSILAVISAGLAIATLPVPIYAVLATIGCGTATFGAVFVRS